MFINRKRLDARNPSCQSLCLQILACRSGPRSCRDLNLVEIMGGPVKRSLHQDHEDAQCPVSEVLVWITFEMVLRASWEGSFLTVLWNIRSGAQVRAKILLSSSWEESVEVFVHSNSSKGSWHAEDGDALYLGVCNEEGCSCTSSCKMTFLQIPFSLRSLRFFVEVLVWRFGRGSRQELLAADVLLQQTLS